MARFTTDFRLDDDLFGTSARLQFAETAWQSRALETGTSVACAETFIYRLNGRRMHTDKTPHDNATRLRGSGNEVKLLTSVGTEFHATDALT